MPLLSQQPSPCPQCRQTQTRNPGPIFNHSYPMCPSPPRRTTYRYPPNSQRRHRGRGIRDQACPLPPSDGGGTQRLPSSPRGCGARVPCRRCGRGDSSLEGGSDGGPPGGGGASEAVARRGRRRYRRQDAGCLPQSPLLRLLPLHPHPQRIYRRLEGW